MRRLVAAGIGVVATLGTIGVAAPAQAATTAAKPFPTLKYGASYYSGTVTFSNRSVTATGLLHSVSGSGCRYASVDAYVGNTLKETSILVYGNCDGVSITRSVGATADVVGGPTSVVVGLWEASSDGALRTLVRTSGHIPR
jgi:hypothetical protein